MSVLFFCPRWGAEDLSLNDFVAKVKEAGYDGIEAVIGKDESSHFLELIQKYDLKYIGHHSDNFQGSFDKYYAFYKEEMEYIASLSPLFINSQTGKDYFSKEQNEALIEAAFDVSKTSSIPIYHEIHRGTFSFCPQLTMPYIEKYKEIQFTTDLSHWANVTESFLENFTEEIDKVITHSTHFHARVGHSEGPQISDPRAPEWQFALDIHMKWWTKLIELQTANNKLVTCTPEFGPYPYMTHLPYKNTPIANQWDINVFMMNYIKKSLSI